MPRTKSEFDQEVCSFVIRMWHEKAATTQENEEWRSWIKHVQSGKQVFFRDPADVVAFINECSGSILDSP